MEDYNADFLTMLETWDAAVGFSSSRDETRGHPVEIAILLGWTQDRSYRDAAVNFWTSTDELWPKVGDGAIRRRV